MNTVPTNEEKNKQSNFLHKIDEFHQQTVGMFTNEDIDKIFNVRDNTPDNYESNVFDGVFDGD